MFRAFKSQNSISRLVQRQVSLHSRPAKASFSYSHHKTDKFPARIQIQKPTSTTIPKGFWSPSSWHSCTYLRISWSLHSSLRKCRKIGSVFFFKVCNYIKTWDTSRTSTCVPWLHQWQLTMTFTEKGPPNCLHMYARAPPHPWASRQARRAVTVRRGPLNRRRRRGGAALALLDLNFQTQLKMRLLSCTSWSCL